MQNWIGRGRLAESNSHLDVWVIGASRRRVLPTLEREYNERLRQRCAQVSKVRRIVERLMLNLLWRIHCPNCQRMTRWEPTYNDKHREHEFALTELSCRRCGLTCRDGYLPAANAHREGAWYD